MMDGWSYAAKLVSDALGFEYDTLGAPKVPFPQSFDVGPVNVIPGNIINIPVAMATTFGPAIAAKLGLTNTKNFGGSTYDSPMMFYEIDVPGKYSLDSKGNTIQSEKPSAAEQIKNTVSKVFNQGKEVVSNLFSFGAEDENAPQREDYPNTRSGAKQYQDAMKLYDAASSLGDETYLTPETLYLPVIPPSDEIASLITAAETGGQAEMDALAKAHAEMMTKHTEAMIKAEVGGASLESLSALSVKQYLARKPLEDALEIDSPVPPMPSEPIEPQREDYPNTRSGAKQYQDAKKAFESQQASREISELSNEDAETRVFDIYEQDPDVFTSLYDPLYENDPVYKEYMGIYDEMEKNATPAGQELLKQQYEALEFTLQGYATEFVDTVLVQPGELNPFGYENTANEPRTFVGKKDAPAGVYFWDMTDREQFEMAGVDLAKYDEARTLIDTYADDFDYNILDYIYAQPDYIEAKAEYDKLNTIYISSSNTSNSAWEAYEKFADKYSGREFDLRFEKSEYERVVKRGEELYKAYEEAENKKVENYNALSEQNRKLDFNKWMDQIDAAGDILDGAREKRNEYWDNYEQELKSKMEVILSKINGDYNYDEDLRALDPQIEELFNRVTRQFLNLYNNRDDILAELPDDVPPGFPDPKTDPDAYYDPFKDEPKPNLGAEDGDELASSLSGGSYGNYYDVGGGDFRGIDQIMRMYNDPKGSEKYGEKMMKNINQIMLDLDLVKKSGGDLGSVASVGGVDATDAATVAASTAEKKRKKGRTSMVAHFAPKGKNLSEVMLVKKTKIQRPKQFFKEPNQFFNVNDIKPEFPENPPPKLDPNTGKHPEYGKKANRYKKLDPISANSMPPTGDPEIDAVVNKQKTINKIKSMRKKA